LSIDHTKLAEAADTLNAEIYSPVFFEKLAAAGIVVENAEESIEFLKLAQNLRAQYDNSQTKVATDRVAALRQINAEISGEKIASANPVVVNPAIARAVLNLSLAEAGE